MDRYVAENLVEALLYALLPGGMDLKDLTERLVDFYGRDLTEEEVSVIQFAYRRRRG